MKLTTNSEESSLYDILGNDVYFSIPLFQRQYVWDANLVDGLLEDFDNVVDQDSSHFLGAVISHTHKTTAAQAGKYDLIDGQQRLTTIFLFICACVRVLSLNKQAENAADYAEKYLFLRKPIKNGSNAKLQPSLNDRAQLNKILKDIDKQPDLRKILGNLEFVPLSSPSDSKSDGKLRRNYIKFVNFLKNKMQTNGGSTDIVLTYLDKVLLNLTMVEIIIEDAATGPTIYNSLNGGQNPMTIGDLVRNGIFSKVASSADEMIQLEETYWRPFYEGFNDGKKYHFDEYFFPYGLTVDPNLKKNDTYGRLQRDWAKIPDATQILELLKKHQKCFMDLRTGGNSQSLPVGLFKSFRKLHSMGAPASIYPFVMQLMYGYESGIVGEKVCIDILETVESFLVRRAVCGHEPTGLHAVFKRLWSEVRENLSASSVENVMRVHKTVKWPSNEDFSNAIKTRNLAGSSIINFLIIELDHDLGGDSPLNKPTIEHVLPKTRGGLWLRDFNEDQHERIIDTFANILPLSAKMNSSMGNSDYAVKSQEYGKNSMYKVTREFSKKYTTWTPTEVQTRAEELSLWASQKWKK